jgi:hypothetical protein
LSFVAVDTVDGYFDFTDATEGEQVTLEFRSCRGNIKAQIPRVFVFSAEIGVAMNNVRVVTAIVCLLFSASWVRAQTYIFGRADFSTGNAPNSIATGDFNGDGILDLAVVNATDNTVSILLGKPDGTFAPQVTYATGAGPVGITAGDFNGDGNLDLAVTNAGCVPAEFGPHCTGHTVSILLGNGDGTFQPHIDYATGLQPSAVAAGDFNGDGKLDLAVANTLDNTVSVLIGNGDGSFQTQVVYPTVSGPVSVITADVNGDHKLDLVVALDCTSCGGQPPSPPNGVSVLLGNGDGTFQQQLVVQGGSPLVAADFNGDGKLDLFAGGSVLLGNGDGTFLLHANYPTGTAGAAADLNGDGKPDLVLTGPSIENGNVSVAVLLGNGDGTFQSPAQYGIPANSTYVTIADFNGDGKFDLAVAADPGCHFFSCSTPGVVSILLGFGDGTFVGGTNYSIPFTDVGSVVAADFNGDGKPDLAGLGSHLGILLGNGDGTFQPAVVTNSLTQFTSIAMATGDFNGDGKADLVVIPSNCMTPPTCLPGNALVLIGNGDGTFQSPVAYMVGLQPRGVVVGDFNGDGKPDIAVGNTESGTVSILINHGDGTFQSHVDYAVGSNPGSTAIGSFRGNGTVDLAVVTTQTVSILLDNSNGIFTSGISLTTPPQAIVSSTPQAIVAGDFNEDGKLDLAVTTETSDQLFIFLGNGDGTFQTPVGYPDGLNFGVPSVGNFNGKPDLIIGGGGGGNISAMLLGNGDGSFQQPIFNFLSGSASAVADFNHDGSPDVAASAPSSLTISPVTVMLSAAFKAISPSSLNFGSEGVGTTGAAQTVTISNPSNVSFNIGSIAASGNFSQTNNCGASLAPAAHCAVSVRFTPSATGTESGSITITDSTKISPLTIRLTGSGVSGPFLTPLPSRANFAPQAVGTKSAPLSVLLINTGNASLNINGISVKGADSSDFTQTNNCGSSLPAAGSCTVNVTFTPAAAGSRTASLAVSDTAPGTPQLANLAGTGLGPIASLSPSTVNFAAQAVGTTSTGQVVTVTNVGDGPLNFTQIAASGDFSETNTCNASLATGSNCQITITFHPTAAGNRAGSISVADNAAGSPQTISVSGVGQAAADFSVGAASGSSTSQTISAGQSAKFNLVLTPSGSFTGTVNLTCILSPVLNPAPTCALSSSSVQISGSAQPVTVTVATTAPVTTGLVFHFDFPVGGTPITRTTILLGLGLLLLWSRRRLPRLAGALIVLAFVSFAWAGCGGGSTSTTAGTTTPGTPAGTYTATVTAASNSLSHTTNLTVVVP